MRKEKGKNKPLLSLAAAGLAVLLLFSTATAVLAQGTEGKFVADEQSGIVEAGSTKNQNSASPAPTADSGMEQAESEDADENDAKALSAETTPTAAPTATPVPTSDESAEPSAATPESADPESDETDEEISAYSDDFVIEEAPLYASSGTSAQDAVTNWADLKTAIQQAAAGATIYLSGEITIPLDEVLSVSKSLRLVGTGSAEYTNTVGVGSETVAQGYTYTQNASLRMGDASGAQTNHDNVMIYISSGATLEIENIFLNGNNNCENVIYTEGADSKISLQNCTVGYSNDNGILLNPGQAEINGSLVFNNGEYAGDGTALYRYEDGAAVLSGNVRSQGLGGDGVTCAAGAHVQAIASSFVWNKTSGFDIPEADSSASAENCFFWGNGWTGANVRSNSTMTLTGCQVESNGYNTANLLTADGDTASNTFPGVDVQGAGTMKISHCGILNNAGNGVQCYPDSKTYLYGWNHIYANGINGVYTTGQLWIGNAADSANGDETTAVYNNAADGVHTDGGVVQGDHLDCYGNSYSGISAMKNESLDQTATLELTAPVTSHENGHSGLYLKGGTKATVSGGSFTENGAEHAEIYAGSGTDTTLKDGVEVKTSADKTLQNSGLRIAVMLDGVDVFRTDSTLQIPAGDSIHLKQDADVVTWNGGTREQLGVTCENPWLGRTIIQSDTAVLDWENSRESNNAQTAEQHPENGIDTNVYYTAIEDAYFGMKNSDAHDVWLSYKSNYRYYYNHDAAAGTALTVDGIDSGALLGTVRKFYSITADVTAPTNVDDTAPYYICSANAGHSAAVQTHRFADWLLDTKTYTDGVTTLSGGAALQDTTIDAAGGSILGSYGDHTTVTAEPAVLSYYAGWQAAMTYDLDGGTLNGAQNGFAETKRNGQSYTVQAEPQKEGYCFLGWKAVQSWDGETVSANGEIALTDGLLAAGTSYANDYDTTFTAQWKKNTFTLTAIAVNGTPDIQKNGQMVSDNITSESDGTTQTKTEREVPLGESRTATYAPLTDKTYLLSGVYLDDDAEKVQNNLAEKYPQNVEFADIDADHTVKAVYVLVEAPTKTVTDAAGNSLNGGTARAGDMLVYTVTCSNPADVAKTVTITDEIPEGTELVENSITENGAESGGTITWTLEIPAQSEASVCFTVRVRSVAMGGTVSNRATVQYHEDSITLPTDEVETNVEPGTIAVTKKLPASDLLAAHGAPVFTFTLTDADGKMQRKNVQLSLDAEPDENGDVCASVTFTGLGGGVYTVTESQTACHALVQFEDAENGTAKADCAVLELTGCRASASVTARNERQSWSEDRDCALIVNEITPKQDNS